MGRSMPKKPRPDEISLEPGTIYFIGECDVKTGEETHYEKDWPHKARSNCRSV
jgi:hypothetical protein